MKSSFSTICLCLKIMYFQFSNVHTVGFQVLQMERNQRIDWIFYFYFSVTFALAHIRKCFQYKSVSISLLCLFYQNAGLLGLASSLRKSEIVSLTETGHKNLSTCTVCLVLASNNCCIVRPLQLGVYYQKLKHTFLLGISCAGLLSNLSFMQSVFLHK